MQIGSQTGGDGDREGQRGRETERLEQKTHRSDGGCSGSVGHGEREQALREWGSRQGYAGAGQTDRDRERERERERE